MLPVSLARHIYTYPVVLDRKDHPGEERSTTEGSFHVGVTAVTKWGFPSRGVPLVIHF